MNKTSTFVRTALATAVAFQCMSANAEEVANAESDKEIEVVEVIGSVSAFGATKSNTPIVETARSLSIEDAEAFTQKGALNLSQATSYMAGVTAESFGFATRGDWVRSRGLSIPRYRDSIQELFGSYNTTRTELYTIEQVEVLRGPASVLFGQGTPGGIVNTVSKVPGVDGGGEVVAEFGSFDRKQLGVDLNTGSEISEKVLGRFVGLVRDADTQVDVVTDNTTVIMPSVTFLPGEDSSITLIALYQDTESDTGSQFVPVEGTLFPLPDGTYIDQDVYIGEPGFNKFDTSSSQVTILGEHGLNDSWTLNWTALWRDGEADYHQAWPVFTGAGASRYLNSVVGLPVATSTTVPRSFYQADNTFEQKAFDVRFSGTIVRGEYEHEFLIGGQFQDVETDNNVAYFFGGGLLTQDFRFVLDLANPVYTGAPDQAVFDAIYKDNPAQEVEDSGFYISDQISYRNWRFTLGARYDDVNNTSGANEQSNVSVSRSAGVLYAYDNGLSPYVSYAESFETVLGQTPDGKALKPQEATQFEFGLKYDPSDVDGFFTLAYFEIEITNLPNPNALPATAAQQQGVSDISGIEFEGEYSVGELTTLVSFTELDTEDPDGFQLASAPERNASLWMQWTPTQVEGLRVGAGIRYVGASVSEVFTTAPATVRYETPSYTLGDLMIGYELNDSLDFALNVRNVSDKEYLTSCLARGDCFPGLRRSVNARVTYSF